METTCPTKPIQPVAYPLTNNKGHLVSRLFCSDCSGKMLVTLVLGDSRVGSQPVGRRQGHSAFDNWVPGNFPEKMGWGWGLDMKSLFVLPSDASLSVLSHASFSQACPSQHGQPLFHQASCSGIWFPSPFCFLLLSLLFKPQTLKTAVHPAISFLPISFPLTKVLKRCDL